MKFTKEVDDFVFKQRMPKKRTLCVLITYYNRNSFTSIRMKRRSRKRYELSQICNRKYAFVVIKGDLYEGTR